MLRNVISLITVVCLGISGWLIACNSNTITDSRDVQFPSSGVSYSRHVQLFFDLSCNFSGCHNKDNPARGLSLASYFDFIGRAGLVIPNMPDKSLLIQVIDTSLSASKLHPPTFQQRITSNQIQGMRTWVKEGALLN